MDIKFLINSQWEGENSIAIKIPWVCAIWRRDFNQSNIMFRFTFKLDAVLIRIREGKFDPLLRITNQAFRPWSFVINICNNKWIIVEFLISESSDSSHTKARGRKGNKMLQTFNTQIFLSHSHKLHTHTHTIKLTKARRLPSSGREQVEEIFNDSPYYAIFLS